MRRYPAPAQELAREVVAANPGCSKLFVAMRIGPHGSRKFGYRTVDRAILRGLIRVEHNAAKGCYALFATSREG